MQKAKQAARDMGMLHEFEYLNYANQAQDPISTYGRKNVGNLRAAATRYDPHGFFQRQVPGGFKLPV